MSDNTDRADLSPVESVSGSSPESKAVSADVHQVKTVDLADALRTHELLGVTEDGVVILADTGDMPDLREIGMTSPSPFTGWMREEYNYQLRGKLGLRKYDEMRRSESTIRGSLRLIKTPVLSARWYIEPGGDSKRDQNVADFIWWNLTDGMTTSWPQLLTECLLMLDFGYYAFEKVFTDSHPQKPGMICWQKLAPRHPMDITEWQFDAKGGPAAVKMYNPPSLTEITIPIDKLLVFTFDKEGGDMEGISLLRSAYKPWHYKSNLEKIDAIQKERHGIGVPIIKLPLNYNPSDKLLAEELGRNLRTNERAHVVLPPLWEIMFAKLEGQPVNAMDSIDYHDMQMQKNVLAPFMNGGGGSGKDDDKTMFLKATRFIADIVTDVFNKYAIPQLVDFNWSRVKYPKLRARRIGEQADWRTMSFAIRNMVGAGIIRPDDELEANIRDEMDLPKVDEDTVRVTASPQMPGGGGVAGGPKLPQPSPARPPRQQPLPSSARNAGTNNTGADRSGG